MNQPASPGRQPNVPRPEAEALIKLMDQELALKRAKLAAEKRKGNTVMERWLVLMLILLILLGVTIWGFLWSSAKIQNYKLQTQDRPSPPPAAPAKR